MKHMTKPLTSLNSTSKKRRFKTPNEFSFFIEKQAISTRNSCYSVLIEFCENNDIDYDKIANLVNQQLRSKLAIEFAEMGMMKPQVSLEEL